MTPSFLVFLVGLLYVVIFWILSLLRRERLSNQFAYEGLGLTELVLRSSTGEGWPFTRFISHIDLSYYHAGAAAGRARQPACQSGRQSPALALYRLALNLYPDKSSRLIALINVGAAYLHQGKPDLAIHVLENAKAHISKQLSPKHAAGCCYNLGMAYRRTRRTADALRQFTEVGDIYPMSMFARLAEKARNATLQEAGMGTFPQKKENDAH